MGRLCAVLALVAVAFAALGGAAAAQTATAGPADDAVVVAVVDGSFNPYHWNFLASKMPQHSDADPANDLPLTTSPDTWLPGFPDPSSFASYQELPLTLEANDEEMPTAELLAADADTWDTVLQSTNAEVHYNWIPGTKFIGAVDFGGAKFRAPETATARANAAHGANTSAVAVGNLHGTCPECLLVAVTYGGDDQEAALNWALAQPWIDVVTNSYGFSLVNRDRLYSGSDVDAQKAATERGQHIFFSSGNGQNNDFVVPNTTYFSSQEGPDWITTVGAVNTAGGNYTGAGKAADIAGVGTQYPSIGGTTVNGTGTFGGTSNATPVLAGMYARALLWARQQLAGPSRAQDSGVVATGAPVACADQRADCELADGVLTQTELRTRFYEASVRTPQGPATRTPGVGITNSVGVPGQDVTAPSSTDEYELLAEGHGTYWGRFRTDGSWEAEQARITGPMNGSAAVTERPAGERDWMVVDSYCRQQLWGTWTGGYWQDGVALPAAAPQWPLRTALASSCDQMFPPID